MTIITILTQPYFCLHKRDCYFPPYSLRFLPWNLRALIAMTFVDCWRTLLRCACLMASLDRNNGLLMVCGFAIYPSSILLGSRNAVFRKIDLANCSRRSMTSSRMAWTHSSSPCAKLTAVGLRCDHHARNRSILILHLRHEIALLPHCSRTLLSPLRRAHASRFSRSCRHKNSSRWHDPRRFW